MPDLLSKIVANTSSIISDPSLFSLNISSGVSVLTPDQIFGSNLKLWIKADSLSLSDGDPVTSWADLSGNSYNFSEATNPPTYKLNIVNGKPVVRFNGTNNFMTSAGKLSQVATATAYSFWVVYTLRANPPNNFTGANVYKDAAIWTEAVEQNGGLYVRNASGTVYGAYQIYPAALDTVGPITNGTFYLHQARLDTGNIYYSVNGGAESTTASGSQVFYASGFILIGKCPDTSSFPQMDLAELVIVNAAGDATSRTQMAAYFNSRYSLY